MGSLTLTRRKGESVLLSHPTGPIIIDIVKAGGDVRLAIRAANEVKVSRINNRGDRLPGSTKEKANG